MPKGKQIPDVYNAPLTMANINASAPNTLGMAVKNALATGAPKRLAGAALVATADGSKATNTTLADKPLTLPIIKVGDSEVGPVGDGVKTGAFYYSADNGVTARTFANMAANDALYVNPTILGYSLDATDTVIQQYNA